MRRNHPPGAVAAHPHPCKSESAAERLAVGHSGLDRCARHDTGFGVDPRPHVLIAYGLVGPGARFEFGEVLGFGLHPAVRMRQQPVVDQQLVQALDIGLEPKVVPGGVDRREFPAAASLAWAGAPERRKRSARFLYMGFLRDQGRRPFRMRKAAQAAPKPLSMFTTTTPAAQLASEAERAVSPPRAAP